MADADAPRRQAILKITTSLMTLTHMLTDSSLTEAHKRDLAEIKEDLTRARFLLVEHEEPDNILDELSQL